MKKVLILAYDTPPFNSIGGQRPWSWYLYFAEQGWHPVVVTRHWDRPVQSPLDVYLPSLQTQITTEHTSAGTLIRVPNKEGFRYRVFIRLLGGRLAWVRRGISLCANVLSFFNVAFDNKGGLYRAARQYMKENHVDAVVATGDPFVLFYYAGLLSKEFGVPWVADYRDCWSNLNEITLEHESFSQKFFNRVFKFIEKRTVRSAALITCPGYTCRIKLQELFPDKNIQIVYNGYFEQPESALPERLDGDELIISHGGTLYPFQPFEVFATGVEKLLERTIEKPGIQVSWYGSTFRKEQENRILANLGVSQFFCTTGRLPREKLLQKFRQSDLLLLFSNKGMISAKVFDYILAGRPILLVGEGGGEMEELVVKHNLGFVCRDSNEVSDLLAKLLAQKKRGVFQAFFPREGLDFFSRRHQAWVMCQLLSSMAHTHPFAQVDPWHKNNKRPTQNNLARPYRQCTRCVMDTTDPEIRFDAQGFCNHCTDYYGRLSPRVYSGHQTDLEFGRILQKIKKSGRGKPYDCIIGLSGGVDSSYAALMAVSHGLRPLGVHLDNGWNAPVGVSNIEKIAGQLGIECIKLQPDPDEFKDLQIAFLKASVPEIETPTDIAIPAVLHSIAAQKGIKYIISGGNFATEGILPRLWHYNAKDLRYLHAIHSRFGNGRLRKFPLFGWQHEAYYKLAKGISMVYLLNFVPFSKAEARAVLESRFGWQYYGGKHYESLYTGFVQSYILPEKFQIDYRKATFSTMICAGTLSRDQALEMLSSKPIAPEEALRQKIQVCQQLGLSLTAFDQLMNDPPRWYFHYPNHNGLLQSFYRLYKLLQRLSLP